jgi:uncharacterized protein YbaA (DUF1428 family)
MNYVEGFVAAVPAANKEAYRKHAAKSAPLFKEFGVTRVVEAWGDDVPDGKVTDFKGAVKAKPDEVVVFSWMEFPSKDAHAAATQKMMSDPRMKEIGASMPFDGKRMIYGGFASLIDDGARTKPGYVDGYLVPVPNDKKEAYLAAAQKAAQVFKDHGAIRVVEAWGDDVPDGKVTDYKGAVKATADENIVYSWVEWPSKQARDEGWKKVMADQRMQPGQNSMPFDGKRMIYGGFKPIVEESAGGKMGYADGYLVAVPKTNREAYRDMAAKAATVLKEYGATRVVEAWGDDVPDGEITDFKRAVKGTKDENVVYSWVEWPSKEARDKAWPKIMEDERMKPDKSNMPFDGQRMIYGGFAPILDQ